MKRKTKPLSPAQVKARTTFQGDIQPGTPECAYQATDSIRFLWSSKDSHTDSWIFALDRLFFPKPVWELIPEDEPYGTPEAFFENETKFTAAEFALAVMAMINPPDKLKDELAKLVARDDQLKTVRDESLKKLSDFYQKNGDFAAFVSGESDLGTLESEFNNHRLGDYHFYERGKTLQAIKRRKLYKSVFGSWKAYCIKHLDYDVRTANREIAAARVIDQLRPIGPTLPQTESQARPLTKRALSQEGVKACWERVLDSGEKITAALVERIVNDYLFETTEESNEKLAKDEPAEPESSEVILAFQEVTKAVRAFHSALLGPKIGIGAAKLKNAEEYKEWLRSELSKNALTKKTAFGTRQSDDLKVADEDQLRWFYGFQFDDQGQCPTPGLKVGFGIAWDESENGNNNKTGPIGLDKGNPQ